MNEEKLPADYYMPGAVVTDWSNFVECQPDYFFRPATLPEMQSILVMFAEGNFGERQLRITGGQHSCSDIFASEVVIDPTAMALEFSATKNPDGSGTVIASAWMHAHEFNRRAGAAGLSLTALGGTDAQTMAGLISTNTAGATIWHSVYETLQWVEYIAPETKWQVQRVEASETNFQGVVASLGAIGFLTRVCFDLVQQRYYTGTFQRARLDDVLGDLDATCNKYNDGFWRIEWMPNSKGSADCLLWTAMPYDGPPPPPGQDDYPIDGTEVLVKKVMALDNDLLSNGPFANWELRDAYWGIMKVYSPMKATGPLRNIIPCDRRAELHCAMAEWSFHPADLPKVLKICTDYFDGKDANGKDRHWPNLPIEIECTRADTFWMSPWNSGSAKYIVKLNFQYLTDFLSDDEKALVVPHLQGLWDALIAAGITFKAHWGKINFLTPDLVSKLYQPTDFLKMVSPLFMNPYLQARLPAATSHGG